MTSFDRTDAILYNQRHRDREADEAIALLIAHCSRSAGWPSTASSGPTAWRASSARSPILDSVFGP
jgi:hypothetical protein